MAKHFSFGFTAYRIHLDSRWLTVISALYFTTVLNLSLWRYILRHLTVADTATFFFGISIPIVIFTALYLLFNLLLIPYLAKPVLILLLFIASATNYFMFEYGIFIDSGMIRNVFETNTREALDLMTLRFILWVIVGGVLPAICLTVTRIDYQSFRTECKSRLFAITGCLITTGMIAAFFSRNMLPSDATIRIRTGSSIRSVQSTLPDDTCISVHWLTSNSGAWMHQPN